MHNNLSGRAAELAHLTDPIRTSLSLADATIPLLNEQLHALAEMGLDNLELEGPRIYSRTAGWSPAFDDEQIIFAAALTMPGHRRDDVPVDTADPPAPACHGDGWESRPAGTVPEGIVPSRAQQGIAAALHRCDRTTGRLCV